MNPDKESGRVTLITRYGASKVRLSIHCRLISAVLIIPVCAHCITPQVEKYLPGHIAAVQKAGHPVIWVCDPMHGKYALYLLPYLARR